MTNVVRITCNFTYTYQDTYQVRSHLAPIQYAGPAWVRPRGLANISCLWKTPSLMISSSVVHSWKHLLMKLGLCDQVNCFICWWLYWRKSTCGCPLYSHAFKEWPLVLPVVSKEKKHSNGIMVKPLYSLNTSIISVRFLLSSRVQSPRQSNRCR